MPTAQRRSARRSHVALDREARPIHGGRETATSKRGTSRSRSPSADPRSRRSRSPAARKPKAGGAAGQNFAEGFVGHGTIFVPLIVFLSPGFCQLLARVTSADSGGRWTEGRWLTPAVERGVTGLAQQCAELGAQGCVAEAIAAATAASPTAEAAQFLLCFAALALALDLVLPGPLEEGPATRTVRRLASPLPVSTCLASPQLNRTSCPL